MSSLTNIDIMKAITFSIFFCLGLTYSSILSQVDSLVYAYQSHIQMEARAISYFEVNSKKYTEKSIRYLDSIAEVHFKDLEYTKADSLFSLSLIQKLKTLEKNNLSIAYSYHRIGLTKYHLKAYDLSIENFKKSFEIRLSHLNEDHEDILKLHHHLGLSYYKLSAYEKMILHYEKIIDNKQKIANIEDSDLGEIYYQTAFAYKKSGNFKRQYITTRNLLKSPKKLKTQIN